MAVNYSIKTTIKAVDRATRPIRRISGALTGKLLKGLRKVNKAAGKATIWLGKMALKAAAAGAAMGMAGAVGVVKLVDSTMKAIDVSARLAKQYGLTVSELQEYTHVARRLGIEEDLLRDGMKETGIRVGELRAKTGSLYGFLEQVGARALIKQIDGAKTTGEAFEMLVEAMREIEDPAARAAFANQAFGGSALVISRLADESAGSILGMRREFRQLGGQLDGKAIKSAQNYMTAVLKLKTAISGIVLELSKALAPWLTKLADRTRKYIVTNRALISQRLQDVFKTAARFVRQLWRWLSKIDWNQIAKDVKKFRASFVSALDAIGGVKTALMALGALMAGSFVLDIMAAVGGVAKLTAGLGTLGQMSALGKAAGGAWGGAFALAAAAAITAGAIIKRGLDQSAQRRKERENQKQRKEESARLDAASLGGGFTGMVDKAGKPVSQSAAFAMDAGGRFGTNAEASLRDTQRQIEAAQDKRMSETLALIGKGSGKRPTLIPKVAQLRAGQGAPTVGGSGIQGGSFLKPSKSQVTVRFVNAPAGTDVRVDREGEGTKVRTEKRGTRRVGE